MSRWQYQSRVDPIWPIPDELTPAKLFPAWGQSQSTPAAIPREHPSRTASFLFFVSLVSVPEEITLDKWSQQEPVVSRKDPPGPARQAESLFFVSLVSAPEVITLDKWNHPEATVSRRGPWAPARTTESLFFVSLVSAPETITIDKWDQPEVAIKRPAPWMPPEPCGVYLLPLPQAVPPMDSWFMPTQVPYLVVAQNCPVGIQDLVEFSVPIVVNMDSWFMPIVGPKMFKPLGPSNVIQNYSNPITVDFVTSFPNPLMLMGLN